MNKVIIITAPSGAGKTTIVHELLKRVDQLAFSVSACTRPQRANEVDGEDYYFLTQEEFEEKVSNGEFLEWEEVYEGSVYGTLKSEVERIWRKNQVVIFDIDVLGAKNLKDHFGIQALAIFIKPPSKEILFDRLKQRGTESEDSYNKRIARASRELEAESDFDAVIVNDDLSIAVNEAVSLVKSFIVTN